MPDRPLNQTDPLDDFARRDIALNGQTRLVYVAGSAFFVNDGGTCQIRLSFSAATHDQIREGVRRLADAIREELREGEPADRSARASTAR